MGEAGGIAVAVFEFELFHLVEGDFGFAGDFGTLGFEFVVEGVEVVTAHDDIAEFIWWKERRVFFRLRRAIKAVFMTMRVSQLVRAQRPSNLPR